jgi:hypothetical protein
MERALETAALIAFSSLNAGKKIEIFELFILFGSTANIQQIT